LSEGLKWTCELSIFEVVLDEQCDTLAGERCRFGHGARFYHP
jgi:hypothetical protein